MITVWAFMWRIKKALFIWPNTAIQI